MALRVAAFVFIRRLQRLQRLILQEDVMKTLVFVTLLMMGFSGPVITDIHATDEAAMRESVKQLETGWNTKSGALFAKPFAEDADYVVINGNYIKGRAVIESQHQRIFDTIYKATNLTLTVKQIRFVRADVAGD